MLKFYWNGIKEDGGKLQTCTYHDGKLINYPEGTITIYKKDYNSFSKGVHAAFAVENDSDMQSDYCVTDTIRIIPAHPLYGVISSALAKKKAHDSKRWAKHLRAVVDCHGNTLAVGAC